MELLVKGLAKSYDKGKTYALKEFEHTFTPGVYGLLGPNGAGKSTLMNILTANLIPDKGEIFWNGKCTSREREEYRERLGYMPQQQNIYDELSGDEFLWYMAALKGLEKKSAKEKIEQMLETVNLTKVRYKKMKEYSGGMKQRILIAQAMLNDPDILIMDEPTAGLDPKERIRIRNFISEAAKGKIVLFATHVISDIEFIANQILLLNHGVIQKSGTPSELLKTLENKVFECRTGDFLVSGEDEKQMEYFRANGMIVSNIRYSGKDVCIRLIAENCPNPKQWKVVEPELEDVYLYYEQK